MNPLDEAYELLEKEAMAKKPLTPRAQKEIQLWHDWNNSGRKPDKLRPLLKSLDPLIKNKQRLYENRLRDIPPPAIAAEFQDQAVNAIKTFDPNRAQLNTWVNSQLRKVNRFVDTYRNTARIGEKRINQITQFQNAESQLKDELGRSPTAFEISDFAKLPLGDVQKLQSEIRRTYPTSQFGDASPAAVVPSKTDHIMRLLPYELTPEENAVFEYVYGVGGKPSLSTNEIAKKLNVSAPKISRLKQNIAKKWGEYE